MRFEPNRVQLSTASSLIMPKLRSAKKNAHPARSSQSCISVNRELAKFQEVREKQFAAIVRFVRHREAKGLAKDMLLQIARDKKLCQLLVGLEDQSEIIAMTESVRDLKMKQSRGRLRRPSRGAN